MKMKKFLALVMTGAMVLGTVSMSAFAEEAASDTPLVVGSNNFSEKFGIMAESVPDQTIADLVGLYLISNDRAGGLIYNGSKGETVEYNGTDYTYETIADITVTENEDTTVYNFKLRDDIVFSDGEPLTADDIIFTMYVYADNDYDGNATLYSTNIQGMENYRLNSTAAESVTEEDVAAALAEMPEDLAAKVKAELILPLLTSEYDWAQTAWEDYAEDYGVASGDEFFATLYATAEDYSVEGKDADTVINEIAEMYGTDYAALAASYGDEAFFDEDAATLAKAYLVEQKTAAGEGEEVPNISGIKKLGDYEVEITTDGFMASTIYQLGFIVEPLHYYGDVSMYDYENNQFGFPRGDLSGVREKISKPLGAGPYKFVKYENKTVYLEANENYYLGCPKIKNLQFREATEADYIPGIEQGTIDLADPSGSKERFEQIKSINSNGELNGDKMNTSQVDNLGYGYIGINANTINVGGDPASDASKNLRKAIATVYSVYRDVTIDSYYGDAAAVIDYPISNTSWAAPQKSDADYEVAYSTDVEGNPIYTEGMTDDEKFAAALEASKGFFEAAGYTFGEDGKITAAPEGAKTSYEVTIGGAGTGDHPTFAILADAKAALETIGFTLEINDITDQNIMWDALNAGTAEMWAAAWNATIDPDMYQTYHSESKNSNYYHINDKTLDANIMDARSTSDQEYRKSVYKQCLDIILDWGVEVPVYQRQNCVVYSSERINPDTFTPDVTTFYKWYAEIQNMEMK